MSRDDFYIDWDSETHFKYVPSASASLRFMAGKGEAPFEHVMPVFRLGQFLLTLGAFKEIESTLHSPLATAVRIQKYEESIQDLKNAIEEIRETVRDRV